MNSLILLTTKATSYNFSFFFYFVLLRDKFPTITEKNLVKVPWYTIYYSYCRVGLLHPCKPRFIWNQSKKRFCGNSSILNVGEFFTHEFEVEKRDENSHFRLLGNYYFLGSVKAIILFLRLDVYLWHLSVT